MSLYRVLFCLLSVLLCYGCGSQKPAEPSPSMPQKSEESAEKKGLPQRIVSLTPSNTEILFALGVGERVVGVTTACDYPSEAAQKPKIGGFQISIEKVLGQKPDLVVAMDMLNGSAIKELQRLKVPLLVVSAKSVKETLDAIKKIGEAVGAEAEAEKLLKDIEARLEKVKQTNALAQSRPSVLMLYGVNPIYTTGPNSYIDEVITLAGGQNAVAKPLPGDKLSPEQVITLRPDVLIAGKEVLAQVKQMPGWSSGIPAVQKEHFFKPSNDAVLVRPSPRLPLAVEELATYLRSIQTDPKPPESP